MYGLGAPEVAILFALFIPGLIAAVIAHGKGRSKVGWFFIGAFFAPAVLVLLFLSPVREIPGKVRQCPACREFIKWDAKVCKHCHTQIGPRL